MRADGIGQRLKEGGKRYIFIVAYLYVCFGAILLYKAAVLGGVGVHFAHFGFAAVKAVIVGKFLLIGEELRVGERLRKGTLLTAILWRSAALLMLLFALTAVEKLLEGLVHGETLVQSFADFGGGTLAELLATVFLAYLVLLPYVAYHRLDEALGRGSLIRLMRSRTGSDQGGRAAGDGETKVGHRVFDR